MLLSDSAFKANDSTDLEIAELKFYVSNMQLLKNGEVVFTEGNSFHLLDAKQAQTLQLSMDTKQPITFDELKFDLGIDSSSNVSGAMGGDLDPTKGMYWTWQSGYINFKLEGTSNICKTRHNEFQFHLGGYQHPFNSLQTVFIEISSKSTIEINIDLLKIFQQINLAQQHHIMSPGQEAMDFSEKVIQSLSINK